MQWLEPWCSVADAGPDLAAALGRELAREVAPGHPLHGVPVEAIGKHAGTDDVLFQLLDGSGRVAVVHLTWSRRAPEPAGWPATHFLASADVFAVERMRPDHEDVVS